MHFNDLIKNRTVDLYDGDLSVAEVAVSLGSSKVTLFSSKSIGHIETDALSIKNFTMASSAAMTVADVCMVDRAAIKTLAVRYPSDAQFVMARIRLCSSWLLGFPGLIRRLILGRIKLSGIFLIKDKANKTTCWVLIKRTKKTNPINRLLLPKSVGVGAFLTWLKEEKINYVVPRFYEKLPELHREGGDLDLLVADEHADKVVDHIRSFSDQVTETLVESVPIGMHSISMTSGVPYYPPQLALTVLDNAIDGPAGSRIPTAIDDFHMFIYHALYHSKGYSTGIPSKNPGKPENPPENDYGGIIQQKAKKLGIKIGKTMEDMDEYMSLVGWQPKRDTLSKIGERNSWVRDRFFGNNHISFTGLTVFIIKERAVSEGLTNEVVKVMSQSGVKIVEVLHLSANQKKRAIHEIRGGNWAGPGRSTDGLFPACLIIAVDPNCVRLTSKHAYEYERTWSKIHKGKIRNVFDKDGEASIVHAADNTLEALEYIDACLSKKDAQNLFEKIERTMKNSRCVRIRRMFSATYIAHLIKFNTRDLAIKALS